MFENKMFEGIHYSRFVASWCRSGGKLDYRFQEWLMSLTINGEHIPEEIVNDIYNYGSNGKLELETSAKIYLEEDRINAEKSNKIAGNLYAQSKLIEASLVYANRAQKRREKGLNVEKAHFDIEISKELLKINNQLCEEILDMVF